MIHEQAIPVRARLHHAALVDPAAPLPPVCRIGPPRRTGSERAEDEAARVRRALAEEANRVEQTAREERENLTRVLQNLQDAATDLRAQQRARLEEMQRVAVELAMAVAAHVLHERLESGDYPIEELVRQAVKRLAPREAVTVALHPDDVLLLERRLGERSTFSLEGTELRLSADATMARGDCRAETGDVSVLSNLEEHLSGIRRDLLHVLPEAEVERRKNGAEDRGLRRFPDRRHTA